ncbi:MAG: cysteine desulfurase [Salinisphaeraceae bacterium]|nr:cysteine desulfurase [Salinisphaeraceae bacterium]
MSIYLDHNATTRMDEAVLEAMLPYLREDFGNASSLYQAGRQARAAIDHAREQVAALVGAHPAEVVFTGGGTEANNLAVKGLAGLAQPGRVLISAVEHPAILEPARALPPPWAVTELDVDANGCVQTAALENALESGDVRLVACMLANNETGVIQDVARLARLAQAAGARFHCDAVQAAGKIPVDYHALGVDTLSLSAHKLYGPKGVGALLRRKHLDLQPQLHGGGHEQGLRGGTENTAAIVGFGQAAEMAGRALEERSARLQALRDELQAGLMAMPGVRVFAADAERIPNTLQFTLPGYDGEGLLMALDRQGIAVSSGSACAAGSGEPSHVLTAMGVDPVEAKGAVRVSLGKDNSQADVQTLLQALQQLSGRAAMPSINPAVMGG